MKILICLLPFFVVSCAQQKEYYIKYSDKQPKVESELNGEGNQYQIGFVVKRNTEIISTPHIVVMEDNKGIIKVSKEIYLPDSWSHPDVKKEEGKKQFKPAAPVFKDPLDFGVAIEVTAAGAKTLNSENWIHVQGKLSYSEIDKEIEQQGNYETLQDYAVAYTTDTALYSIFIKNGESSKIKVKLNDIYYEMTVSAKKL